MRNSDITTDGGRGSKSSEICSPQIASQRNFSLPISNLKKSRTKRPDLAQILTESVVFGRLNRGANQWEINRNQKEMPQFWAGAKPVFLSCAPIISAAIQRAQRYGSPVTGTRLARDGCTKLARPSLPAHCCQRFTRPAGNNDGTTVHNVRNGFPTHQSGRSRRRLYLAD